MNILKKAAGVGALLTFGFLMLLVSPKTASANHSPFVFFVNPPNVALVQSTAGAATVTMNLAVKNSGNEGFTTPLCATDLTTGRFLGCVPGVHLSAGEVYHFRVIREFTTGTHVVTFSYQAPSGAWHGILSPNHTISRAVFTVN